MFPFSLKKIEAVVLQFVNSNRPKSDRLKCPPHPMLRIGRAPLILNLLGRSKSARHQGFGCAEPNRLGRRVCGGTTWTRSKQVSFKNRGRCSPARQSDRLKCPPHPMLRIGRAPLILNLLGRSKSARHQGFGCAEPNRLGRRVCGGTTWTRSKQVSFKNRGRCSPARQSDRLKCPRCRA